MSDHQYDGQVCGEMVGPQWFDVAGHSGEGRIPRGQEDPCLRQLSGIQSHPCPETPIVSEAGLCFAIVPCHLEREIYTQKSKSQ